MVIAPLQFDPVRDLTSQADRDGSVRSPRLHVSQIFHDIEVTLNRKHRTGGDMGQGELDSYRAMGFMWEYGLEAALENGQLVRPGEVECDGIVGSPDFFDMTDMTVVETKATYRTFRKMGEDGGGLRGEFWIWDVQMKSYCRMMGTVQAKLFVAFVNGDYKKYGPMFRGWKLTYTMQEIVENWKMLVQHAVGKGWVK